LEAGALVFFFADGGLCSEEPDRVFIREAMEQAIQQEFHFDLSGKSYPPRLNC
jgi:hypothetical protein